jgi:hypothetical protein
MNKFIPLIMICCFISYNNAQTIFSNGTGGGLWSSGSTWLGGVVPNANSDVVIAGGDSVYTLVGAVCNNLTLYNGGIFATSVDTVGVASTLTLEDGSTFYNKTTNPRVPGQERILEPNSTVVHSGSGTIGGVGNDVFGNLVIQRAEGCTPATSLLIQGNLIINNSANNVVFRGARPPTTGSQIHTILGDVHVLKGILSCIDVGDNAMSCVWNIEGSVYVTDAGNNRDARIGPFSSANASGLGIFNIGGDLIVNGGRLQAGTSSTSGPGTGIINLGGNLVLSSTAAIATNTLGPFALNFVGTGTQTVSSQIHFSMGTNVYDTVKVGSSVVFDLDTCYWRSTTGGDFVVNGSLEMKTISRLMGAGSFTLNTGGTLKIGSPDGISLADTLGNIRVAGTRTFSEGANYEYKSNVSQIFGDGLPTTINGFAVNNPNGLLLNGNMNVNSSLKMLSGDLDLNGNTITLGSNAVLTEMSGNTVKGSTGKITITTELNAPSSINVGGLGATITSSVNLGSTTVERYHYIPSGGGAQGISRVYNIVPTNNAGLSATLKLNYDESELNGIDETKLGIYRSMTGNDNSWNQLGGTVNTSQNSVEYSGLNQLNYFTLGDVDSPLPVEEENESLPQSFSLSQNFPNPFNPSTVIKYQVPENSFITIRVYDVLGKEVAILVDQEQAAGYYSILFDASKLSSGIYYYTMKSGIFNSTNKMLLIK